MFRYQAPAGSSGHGKSTPKQENKSQKKKIDLDTFESFGLRSSRTKNTKRKPHDGKGNRRHSETQSYVQTTEKREVTGRSKPTSGIHFREADKAGPSGVG